MTGKRRSAKTTPKATPKKTNRPPHALVKSPRGGGLGKAKAAERKDQVLQARVPQSLYDELAAQARRLRVPVSNLVRNILEDSVRMVGNIVYDSLEIALALSGRADDRALSDVLGWQPMTANRRITCARCRVQIPKSAEAFLSVGAPGGRNIVICGECRCKL